MKRLLKSGMAAAIFLSPFMSRAGELLVEAESFNEKGGWCVDQQFMDFMGSPYLLAHGLGEPVGDAVTEVVFPETGAYNVYVRTGCPDGMLGGTGQRPSCARREQQFGDTRTSWRRDRIAAL